MRNLIILRKFYPYLIQLRETKNTSIEKGDESWLVAEHFELSNRNQLKNDFLEIAEFSNQSSSSSLLVCDKR